jgi:hypothetical protein
VAIRTVILPFDGANKTVLLIDLVVPLSRNAPKDSYRVKRNQTKHGNKLGTCK